MKIIIEYKSMAQVNMAFAQGIGIRITGTSKYAPIIFADADESQIAKLQADPNVKRVSLDANVGTQDFTTLAEVSGNDIQMPDALEMINAHDAWNKGFTGKGIKIAIIDTGFWEAHEWLAGKTVGRWSYYNDDASRPRQIHGTHVAGIAASVAKDAQLINIKVLDDEGNGTFSAIMSGLEKAYDMGAQVANMSLGGFYEQCFDGHPLETLIDSLSDRMIICIAAGNSGSAPRTICFPGSARKSVAVAAVDKDKNVAYFSSRGTSFCDEIRPDISAPGTGIVSSIPPDQYGALSGTSMAAPFCSGMMAILRQKAFFTDRRMIENILKASGGAAQKNDDTGWGVIDVSKALDAIQPGAPPVSHAGVGYVLLAGIGIAVLWGLLHAKKIV